MVPSKSCHPRIRLLTYIGSKTQDARIHTALVTMLSKHQQDRLMPGKSNPSVSPDESSILVHTGKSSLAASRRLVAQYKDLCKQVSSSEASNPENAAHKDEHEVLQDILRKQGEKAKLEVQHLLYGGEGKDVKVDGIVENDARSEDDMLWTRISEQMGDIRGHVHNGRNEDGRSRAGWADITNGVQRGVQRMVQDLPKEIDELFERRQV